MTGSKPLRVAVAGAGMVSGHHLPAWRSLADVEVAAICDIDPAQARARAEAFGIPQVFADVETMLAETRPDALDIALPPDMHVPALRIAARHGIAVLCQKPLAPSLAEAREIAAEIGDAIPVMVHENWRRRAHYRRLSSWLASGRLGRAVAFEMSLMGSGLLADAQGRRPTLERQPFFRDLDRFLVIEVLIHHLDTLAYLLGPVIVKSAALSNRSGALRGEDTAIIHLAAGGVDGCLAASSAVGGEPALPGDRLSLYCEHGTVRLDGWDLEASLEGLEPLSTDPASGYEDSYRAAIADFVGSLKSGVPFETGLPEALAALKAVETVYTLSRFRPGP